MDKLTRMKCSSLLKVWSQRDIQFGDHCLNKISRFMLLLTKFGLNMIRTILALLTKMKPVLLFKIVSLVCYQIMVSSLRLNSTSSSLNLTQTVVEPLLEEKCSTSSKKYYFKGLQILKQSAGTICSKEWLTKTWRFKTTSILSRLVI